MKKIPTLFKRLYENHKIVGILPEVTPGMEWVLEGKGIATEKIDGSCCAIKKGEFYKRYDCKRGRKPPKGFIPCCEPDKISGHWPCWIRCEHVLSDKWFWDAYFNSAFEICTFIPQVFTPKKNDKMYMMDFDDFVTFEAIGKNFNGNPYNIETNILIAHGRNELHQINRTFEGIKEYLYDNYIEGIVFWKDGQPQCKIKRSDFGFDWNKK